jgi:hypothetical protein
MDQKRKDEVMREIIDRMDYMDECKQWLKELFTPERLKKLAHYHNFYALPEAEEITADEYAELLNDYINDGSVINGRDYQILE